MGLNDAMKLIKTMGHDASLRRELISCTSSYELTDYLYTKGYNFTISDYHEAIESLEGDRADDKNELLTIANWFKHVLISIC